MGLIDIKELEFALQKIAEVERMLMGLIKALERKRLNP